MLSTTRFLVEKTNALIGYTQSDEISLVLYSDNPNSELIFNGKVHKMNSTFAAWATLHFNKQVGVYLPAFVNREAIFDCRVWNVPTQDEAVNAVLWRELDATKNSVQAAAQFYFSHKELHGKHEGEQQEMLFQKGINWNDYPARFKRGSYVRRTERSVKFTTNEIEKLPAKHAARSNPDLMVTRTIIESVELPPLQTVTNRVEVFFNGEEPKTAGMN